jgi:hypothetical protein
MAIPSQNVNCIHWPAHGTIACAAMLLCASLALSVLAAPPRRKPLDELPKVAELPDPFLMADGSRVKTAEDWKKRRAELIDLVLAYEFGELPPSISNLKSEITSTKPTTRPAEIPGATESDIVLTMGPENKIKLHLHLLIPAPPQDKSLKFPVILCGDQGPAPWGVKPEIMAAVVQRGYMLALFDRTELAVDKINLRAGGVYDAWPDYNGSAMSAWAWGYHRAVDYLLTRDDVDVKHIAITGHSRGGKAVLLAGALDERIALTAPNGSGCGGCGCYRFQAPKSEAIENITKNFPYWFESKFPEFIGHVDQIPFDQHSIKALIAPRAFLETSGLGDLWANPEGSQQSWLAAREVFDFLGVRDQIGIAWREGKHEHNMRDWSALLDFADWRFFGKNPERAFDTLAFPDSEKRYTWSKPG